MELVQEIGREVQGHDLEPVDEGSDGIASPADTPGYQPQLGRSPAVEGVSLTPVSPTSTLHKSPTSSVPAERDGSQVGHSPTPVASKVYTSMKLPAIVAEGVGIAVGQSKFAPLGPT